MNRFLFGRGWVFCDETNGEGDGNGTGGGAAPAGDGEGESGGEGEHVDGGGEAGGEGSAAGGAEKKEQAPKDMKSAIDAALGYKKGPNGEALDPLTGKVKAVEKPGEKKPEDKHPNGAPKKNEKGEALDPEGKVQKPKAKTAAELDLKPEQLKLLKPETQARFREVIGTLKEREAAITTLTETNKTLKEGRDAILGVMQETKTTQDQLAGYLEFNSMLQSGDPKKLEQALGMLEKQRVALYQALGREPEGGGIDLLADFPDLQAKVTDAQITREDALEIAQGRRDKAARDTAAQRQQQQQRQQTQSADQKKQAGEAALADIEKWTKTLATTDLDYKAKEDKLLLKLNEVLKSYPPNLWLSTLKMMYEGIEITKAASVGDKRQQPLRPSGAKPGAKAPNSMLDAINQGLGYAGAEKG